jgi:hypothetical protein
MKCACYFERPLKGRHAMPQARLWATLAILGCWSAEAAAQQNAVAVQLPTFSQFSVLTTVSVPDRGGAYMGGHTRAQSGRSRFGAPGLPGQGAFGGARHAAGLHVSAHIHDLRELDDALLAGTGKPAARPGGDLAQQLADQRGAAAGQAMPGVEAIRRQQAAAASAEQAEAMAFLERANQAEAAGKTSVARIHLQMAARRATGSLREEALSRLKLLETQGR